jgi:magnesium transporter
VLYLLADVLIDKQFPILDTFNEELDDLEAAIFELPEKHHLQRVFELKRMLMQFRRVLSPQRDVVGLLARRGIPNIQDRTTLYFRDVYDHLVRLYEQIDSGRDILGNVMDGYLSMVANKTNDITKQLTIFATIFLPLSFIVGFFGQNFAEIQTQGFYYAMWGMIIVFPVALIFWFKRKRWF